jgi:hypothetical protein
MNLYAGRGAGRLVSQVVLPLGICLVIQRTGTLQPIHIWLAILAGHAARFSLSFAPFRQGRRRAIAVDFRPAVQQESA